MKPDWLPESSELGCVRGISVVEYDDMANPVSGEAQVEFRQILHELLVAVDERLALDAGFDCAGIGCDQLETSRRYNREFGRLLAAVYEFGLFEMLGDEIRWYAAVLMRRGFSPVYFGRMLEAWSVAIVSTLPRTAAVELARPIDELRSNLGMRLESAPATAEPSTEVARYLQVLLDRDRRAAAAAALARRTPAAATMVELVLPALHHVGRLWEIGRVTVADEHAATEICRYVIYRLFDSVELVKQNGLKGLVACVPGDEHELGAVIVAEGLRLHGWATFLIGRSSPDADILKALTAFRADVAFFSVTMIANLPAAKRLVAAALSASPRLGVVLGGRAAELAARHLVRPRVEVVTRFDAADEAGRRLVGRDA